MNPGLRRRVAAFFADRNPDDVLLLHFSCHGLKDQRGRLYLAAADTELSFLAATGLPASSPGTRAARTSSSVQTTLSGHDNGIQSMGFSPDGKLLVSSAAGGTTRIWDVATRTATATLPKVWFPQWISPDGGTFAVHKMDKSFELRSLPAGKLMATVADAGEFAGFNANGSAYATATAGTVRLYAVATQKELIDTPLTVPIKGDVAGQGLMPLTGHSGTVTDMVFTQGGEVLITTGTDKTVRRWWVRLVQPTRYYAVWSCEYWRECAPLRLAGAAGRSPAGRLARPASRRMT
ncbi:hypothetical protein [Micromonospora sp. CPCC 206061]|uniref:hypothetical protein n=1 Tax=Micromonospora sp. CPCC 206061 TaxID=3122410 RepID=UPI002FF2A4BF